MNASKGRMNCTSFSVHEAILVILTSSSINTMRLTNKWNLLGTIRLVYIFSISNCVFLSFNGHTCQTDMAKDFVTAHGADSVVPSYLE